jgi:hypothetical protein
MEVVVVAPTWTLILATSLLTTTDKQEAAESLIKYLVGLSTILVRIFTVALNLVETAMKSTLSQQINLEVSLKCLNKSTSKRLTTLRIPVGLPRTPNMARDLQTIWRVSWVMLWKKQMMLTFSYISKSDFQYKLHYMLYVTLISIMHYT